MIWPPSGPDMDDRGRVGVVLLRSDDPQHAYLEARLAHDLRLLGVIVEPGRRERAWYLGHRQWSAWLWRKYHSTRQRLTGRAAYRREYFGDATAAIGGNTAAHHVERISVDWINSAEVRDFLDLLRPDLLVVCGTGYLRRETLAAAPVAVNIHSGYLPYYRGNHGIFFAFEKADFSRIGASIHVVSARLDGGPLLAVVRPDMFPHDSDEHLYCRAVKAAIDLLCRIVLRAEAGLPVAAWEQPHSDGIYRHRDRTPYREARLWVRRHLGRCRPPRLAGCEVTWPRPPSTSAESGGYDQAVGNPLLFPFGDQLNSYARGVRCDRQHPPPAGDSADDTGPVSGAPPHALGQLDE
jgi:folate-dependent phosphoribosylglycinamide formyltransferase PurN